MYPDLFRKHALPRGLVLGAGLCLATTAQATDLYRAGSDPTAMGAGAIISLSDSPLTALSANPALLSGLPDGGVFALQGLWVEARFVSSLGEAAEADEGPGILPEFAIKRDVTNSRWSWGAGFMVSSAMEADFRFNDPPGAADVSYGLQTHRASYVVAEVSGALSYRLSDKLAAGLSLGLLYNRNQLEAPYIFQSFAPLQGLKVLVDLDADDIAANAGFGLSWRLRDDLHVQLAYTLETEFEAEGQLDGNLAGLGLGIRQDFSYGVEVETALPALFTAGLSWSASDRLRIGLQFDRIAWGDSFDSLPITLTGGSNEDLNGVIGSDGLRDVAPLLWEDEDVWHLGAEYALDGGVILRAGFEDSEHPVPTRTLTPMTGAIIDRAFSLGARLPLSGRMLDLYYRYSDSETLRVDDSLLLSGEYNGSSLSLGLHSLGLSISF